MDRAGHHRHRPRATLTTPALVPEADPATGTASLGPRAMGWPGPVGPGDGSSCGTSEHLERVRVAMDSREADATNRSQRRRSAWQDSRRSSLWSDGGNAGRTARSQLGPFSLLRSCAGRSAFRSPRCEDATCTASPGGRLRSRRNSRSGALRRLRFVNDPPGVGTVHSRGLPPVRLTPCL